MTENQNAKQYILVVEDEADICELLQYVLEREGLAQYIDGLVLSCEVGSVKPDTAIFQASLDSIDSTAAQTLMVGDSGHDDVGGTALGMRTLVLPRTRGTNHGLAVVVGLVLASR